LPQTAFKNKKPLAVKSQKKIGLADETILTPNFARLIREARMKMGLTHEQLGMKMNEKAQLLKKFETGSLKPDEIFARKLERYLGIRLYVSTNSDEE
jgi:putative transcription factor